MECYHPRAILHKIWPIVWMRCMTPPAAWLGSTPLSRIMIKGYIKKSGVSSFRMSGGSGRRDISLCDCSLRSKYEKKGGTPKLHIFPKFHYVKKIRIMQQLLSCFQCKYTFPGQKREQSQSNMFRTPGAFWGEDILLLILLYCVLVEGKKCERLFKICIVLQNEKYCTKNTFIWRW